MLKKLFLIFFFLLFPNFSQAEFYRGVDHRELPNGISVIFFITHFSDSVYMTLSVSAGKSDDIDKTGKAEIVGNIFKKNLERDFQKNTKIFGVELNSYIGQDQSLFSLYGKKVDLEEHIKCLAKNFYDTSFSQSDFEKEKEKIRNKFDQVQQLDKNQLREESLRSLYWHSSYGRTLSLDELASISAEDLSKFKSENYTNNRVTLIISGHFKNNDIEKISKMISENFSKKNVSKIKRLEEPFHHNSTVRIEKNSKQVNVPVIEIYWKIPKYVESEKNEKSIALEIFFNYLKNELSNSLVNKSVSAITFDYSFWNYFDGHLRISFTMNEKKYSQKMEFEILNEIRKIVLELTDKKLFSAQNELYKSADVYTYQTDVIDSMNWFSEKVGAGYKYEFLKQYPKLIKGIKLEKVNKIAEELFKKDPDVISILKPEGDKDVI